MTFCAYKIGNVEQRNLSRSIQGASCRSKDGHVWLMMFVSDTVQLPENYQPLNHIGIHYLIEMITDGSFDGDALKGFVPTDQYLSPCLIPLASIYDGRKVDRIHVTYHGNDADPNTHLLINAKAGVLIILQ